MEANLLAIPSRKIAESEVSAFVDELMEFPAFADVPRVQIEWLVERSEYATLAPGQFMKPGDSFPGLIIVLEGRLQAYSLQGGQKKVQQDNGPGALTGNLPFSRMKASPVYGDALEPMRILTMDSSHFSELLCDHFELAGALVHALIDRVRHFTSMHFQNEKLMSLGKLSAGITHELNNPAAAIVRSAQELKQTIGLVTENLSRLASLSLTQNEIGKIRPIAEKLSGSRPNALPFSQRVDKEDELIEWADSHAVDTECATTFLDTTVTTDDLDVIAEAVPSDRLSDMIRWLADSVKAEQLAEDIAMASRRVSDLVKSLKNYTRMDQDDDMQEVAINESIRNTLTILQHKVRKNDIVVHQELDETLPAIMGFPGELTQIWTNIIDNALDAMKSGGELTVKTVTEPQCVVFSVIDSGPGIPAEHLERIFDPFFTTKDVGEGTGVGLDVVQKVVQLHKGTIKVDSKPGRTEFRISFPRART
jgi:signal transduction histidine kinase